MGGAASWCVRDFERMERTRWSPSTAWLAAAEGERSRFFVCTTVLDSIAIAPSPSPPAAARPTKTANRPGLGLDLDEDDDDDSTCASAIVNG